MQIVNRNQNNAIAGNCRILPEAKHDLLPGFTGLSHEKQFELLNISEIQNH